MARSNSVWIIIGVWSVLSHPLVTAFTFNRAAGPAKRNPSETHLCGHKTNKAMDFLRKIGKVGGKANKDYRFALGLDEGPAGKTMGSSGSATLLKIHGAYKTCIETGCIDDISQPFPKTSCGTEWSAFTDTVMGGVSQARLARENFLGRTANVLRGSVSLLNGGGFIQMACHLDPSHEAVDASMFDGLQIDVACELEEGRGEIQTFNVHLKNAACIRPFSSYRTTFEAPLDGHWNVIRIPWSRFQGHGPGASEQHLDIASLIRVGVVAIGRPMKVVLGISSIRLYKELAVP